MGFKGKKDKFKSEMDIFAKEAGEKIKTKTYMWASIRIPNKIKNKGTFISVIFFLKLSRWRLFLLWLNFIRNVII